MSSGADLGGGGGADAPPSGIRPPADPKGPPFDTFSEIHFWPTDPKIFLKAPLAPIYTNFEGERAPKKRDFFVKIFQNCPKTAFLTVFSKICLRRRKFSQSRAKTVLWESSKNQFGRPKKKKKVVKILENFLKIRPPLEKILDPPLIELVADPRVFATCSQPIASFYCLFIIIRGYQIFHWNNIFFDDRFWVSFF